MTSLAFVVGNIKRTLTESGLKSRTGVKMRFTVLCGFLEIVKLIHPRLTPSLGYPPQAYYTGSNTSFSFVSLLLLKFDDS